MEKLIYTKIPKIMGLIGSIGKDHRNQQQNYNFRGIDDIYNALNKHLADEKIFATSEILQSAREERESKNGGILIYTILRMKFTFYAEDGSSIETITEGEAMDSGDKSTNKAMSTAYKYAFLQLFCIPTDEEKDTEYQSPEVKVREKSPEAKKCPKCGSDMVYNPKTGKEFCSAKCFLNN